MRCVACGYSDQKDEQFDHRHGFSGPVNGSAAFIPITFNYEKTVLDACHTKYHWQTLYGCPNCGAVKMDLPL